MSRDTANLCYLTVIFVLVIGFAMSGCATQDKSAGLGGAIGAGTGVLLGGIADPGRKGEYRTRNVVIGGALGAMAGLVAGSVIHDEMDSQKKESFLKGRASGPERGSGIMPTLKNPKVESHWIEGHVIGNRYIEGHFEYVITEQARWDN